MRQDSWVRGALLGVLFFALVVGAPLPTMAVSDAGNIGTTPCGSGQTVSYARGSAPCVDLNPPQPDYCGTLQAGFDNGSLDTITAGLIAGGLITANKAAVAAGGLLWALARLGRGACKLTGNWG